MVLKRVASALLVCLGAAFAMILLSPSSASACGQVNYKDGDPGSLGDALQCPSGPDYTGIGGVGGGTLILAFVGGRWVYVKGGKAAGNPRQRGGSGSGPKPDPWPDGTDSGPRTNPFRRPQPGGDPRIGDPSTLPESVENPKDGVEGALDLAGNAEQSIAGTVQQAAGVGMPPPPPGWAGGDLWASGDPVGFMVQMVVATAAGIRIRVRGVR